MRPHARIRKTIKWGGAAVTVLLVVVWVGSELHNAYRLLPQHDALRALNGKWWINSPISSGTFGGEKAPDDWWVSSCGGAFVIPMWMPFLIALGTTVSAWHLDTLARCRERVGRCPKCNYDRAGLAKDAVCPECGSAAP